MDAPKLMYLPIEQIRAECTALFERYLGKTVLPSQPEAAVIGAMAERESILRAKIDGVIAELLIPFSTAPMLDQLVVGLGIARNDATPAGTTIEFILQPGHGALSIPAGLRVASTDGRATFQTDGETFVSSSTDKVTANVTATEDGPTGNNFPVGTITEIVDPKPYLKSASNTTTTSGGAVQETDEQLRKRAVLALSRASNAGSKANYKALALGASPLIIDAAVTSPLPGQVNVYPLVSNQTQTPQAILDAVFSELNADTVRPITDTVVVLSPNMVEYQLTVSLVLKYGAPFQQTRDAVYAALNKYCVAQSKVMGADITESQLVAAAMNENVHSMFFIDFVDLHVNQISFPVCKGIYIGDVTIEDINL